MDNSSLFLRTEMLLGKETLSLIQNVHVAIFGIGGVGGYAAEALVRLGIREFTLVDDDDVSESNVNRQIIATSQTIGMAKVDVMKKRMMEINPLVRVNAVKCFFTRETQERIDFSQIDMIVDAIDTVSSKILLAETAQKMNISIVSCMGAGNKLDPTRFEVADIYETSVCPLAKVMRQELKKRGIKSLKVVYSKEPPFKPFSVCTDEKTNKVIPASISFVPAAAGLALASACFETLKEKACSKVIQGEQQ